MSAAARTSYDHIRLLQKSTAHARLYLPLHVSQRQRLGHAQTIQLVPQQGHNARFTYVVQGTNGGHAGHAILHDFCMTIPYGGLAAVAAVLACIFKASALGLQLAAVAAVVGITSVLSLKAWKAGSSSTAYTLVSAGTSGWVAYQMWQRVCASATPLASWTLLSLSAALCAFCVYNVLAGGNPPPSKRVT